MIFVRQCEQPSYTFVTEKTLAFSSLEEKRQFQTRATRVRRRFVDTRCNEEILNNVRERQVSTLVTRAGARNFLA